MAADGGGTAEGSEATIAGMDAPDAKRARTARAVVRASELRRAVDLYVDGELVAWFYEAPAPARDAPLVCEKGRAAVWFTPKRDGEEWERVSAWHAVVLSAWQRGERRADYTTPSKLQK